jgi:Zn-dependent protease
MGALQLHLGKIPVRIHATFFVMAAVLGLGGTLSGTGLSRTDLIFGVSWVLVVLVSVLIHELGHAGVGILFGLEPRIDLHAMGGTTSWANHLPLSHGKRIAISLAGPFAGFALGASIFTLGMFGAFPHNAMGEMVRMQLLQVNIFWGVVNLLPMLPLDGGNVMTQLLHIMTGGRGERPGRIVSIGMAVLLIPLAIRFGWGLWGMLLIFSFLASNWRGLQELTAREHDAPMRASLEKAQAALDAKDAARVLEFARPVALAARTEQVKAEALHLVAFGFLLEGRVADADAAIAALPRGYAPHPQLMALREVASRQ